MGVRAHAAAAPARARPRGPGVAATLVVVVVALALLIANGRVVGTTDTAGAAGWLLAGALALVRLGFELDESGAALVGKALAALCAALAAGALFGAVARRHGPAEARWAGLVLALGTTLAAAAQAWSGEAAATCAVAVAVLLLVRAEEEGEAGPAALAGLPLGLAVALQPSTVALALVLVLAVLVRWRAPGLLVLVSAAPGALVALGTLAASSARPSPTASAVAASGPVAALALLASPARGLFVFVPVALVALVGVVRALRRPRRQLWDQAQPSRLLPVACLVAAIAHVAWLAAVGGWDQGPFWGPRLVAPAWPLVLLFLPEGFATLKLLATVLVVGSIGIQALGALSYDGRWDKLYGAAAGARRAGTWDLERSPIAFHARERVARVAVPAVEGRRLTSRPRAFSARGAAGSFVSFARLPPAPTGVDAIFDGLRFEGDVRFEAEKLLLSKEGDGMGFRVREGARPRRLELRIVGRGQGRIGVAESGSGSGTRWRDATVAGPFRLRLPYFYADSGGADVRIVLRSGGPVALESVALVPPSEPENVLRLP